MMMPNKSRRYRIGKALLIALVAAQGLFAFSSCLLASSHVSMAFASVDMPGDCGGANKQACLMTYLQDDRAPAFEQATPPAGNQVVLSAPLVDDKASARVAVEERSHQAEQAAAPPPRTLFCRLLN
jgi:hypothetical protein